MNNTKLSTRKTSGDGKKAIQIQNEKQTARDKFRWKTGRINRILHAMHTTEKNERKKKSNFTQIKLN